MNSICWACFPALAGPKFNLAGLVKLQKAKHLVPSGISFPVENLSLFLCCLPKS